MKLKLASLIGAVALLVSSPVSAKGTLNIFTYGNTTSPEMIERFEKTYDIKVTITDFDTADTALAKVRAGGHDFDIVTIPADYVPVWIKEGLLLETRPDQMESFKNVDPSAIGVYFDPGRHYTAPWLWGTLGMIVNTDIYKGDPNTSAIFLDPPKELIGKIVVVPEMTDVMRLAIRYMGGQQCTDDKKILRAVRDKLMEAKPKWLGIEYTTIEKFAAGDYAGGTNWNGESLRVRLQAPHFVYGYPKEGYSMWMDSVAVLADAKNVENAKLYQKFVMEPENAALASNFARYANWIVGSEKFMDSKMAGAPEVYIPKEHRANAMIAQACPPEVNKIYTQIWTELNK